MARPAHHPSAYWPRSLIAGDRAHNFAASTQVHRRYLRASWKRALTRLRECLSLPNTRAQSLREGSLKMPLMARWA
jgi:hypothetical protein